MLDRRQKILNHCLIKESSCSFISRAVIKHFQYVSLQGLTCSPEIKVVPLMLSHQLFFFFLQTALHWKELLIYAFVILVIIRAWYAKEVLQAQQ